MNERDPVLDALARDAEFDVYDPQIVDQIEAQQKRAILKQEIAEARAEAQTIKQDLPSTSYLRNCIFQAGLGGLSGFLFGGTLVTLKVWRKFRKYNRRRKRRKRARKKKRRKRKVLWKSRFKMRGRRRLAGIGRGALMGGIGFGTLLFVAGLSHCESEPIVSEEQKRRYFQTMLDNKNRDNTSAPSLSWNSASNSPVENLNKLTSNSLTVDAHKLFICGAQLVSCNSWTERNARYPALPSFSRWTGSFGYSYTAQTVLGTPFYSWRMKCLYSSAARSIQ